MKSLSFVAAGVCVALASCSLTSTLGNSPFVLKTVVKTVEPYFHGPGIDGMQFDKVGKRVYTFRWNWYRNLIIDTDDGLVVIDPMNQQMAAALRTELDGRFPGKRVHSLIYSHYHLDHTSGGAALEPLNVLAHEACASYWAPLDHSAVLPPTRVISGDTVLTIGSVEIRALHLPNSHTDTLYAFHLPSERLLFTADLGLVRTMAPGGVPDRYAPGYLAAMDRLIELDFDTFVPSHFGYGKKQDLVDWRNMMEESRRLARQAVKTAGTPGIANAGTQMGKYFDAVYDPLREKYGHWHGFNEMFVLNLVRDVLGESLGY